MPQPGPREVEAPASGHTAAWSRPGPDPQPQELVVISISFRGPEGHQPFTPVTSQEAAVSPVLVFEHTLELFSVDSETRAAATIVKVRTCLSPQQEAPVLRNHSYRPAF